MYQIMPKLLLFRLLNLWWYLRIFEEQSWLETAFHDEFTVMNYISKPKGISRYRGLHRHSLLFIDIFKQWFLSVFCNPLEIIFILWSYRLFSLKRATDEKCSKKTTIPILCWTLSERGPLHMVLIRSYTYLWNNPPLIVTGGPALRSQSWVEQGTGLAGGSFSGIIRLRKACPCSPSEAPWVKVSADPVPALCLGGVRHPSFQQSSERAAFSIFLWPWSEQTKALPSRLGG